MDKQGWSDTMVLLELIANKLSFKLENFRTIERQGVREG